MPTAMGGTRVVICDPKAIVQDTYTYVGVPLMRKLMTKFVSLIVDYAVHSVCVLNSILVWTEYVSV